MKLYFYARKKNRELFRMNLAPLAFFLAMALIASAVVACSGCAYRVIPESAAQKVESVPPALRKQAASAKERAEGHRAQAAAAATPQEAQARADAAAEADHAAKVEEAAGAVVEDGMGESKPVLDFAIEKAAPVLKPVAAAATAYTGLPWEQIIMGALGLATTAAGAYGVNRHLEAKSGKRVNDFEEYLAADPSPETGGFGTIAYDHPATKAKVMKAKAEKTLTDGDIKKMYPGGLA